MTGDGDAWTSGDRYEAYIGRWSRLVAPQFLAWLGLPPGQRWLDVGTGTGALATAILDFARPQRVTGIDPSPDFIAYARAVVTDRRASFGTGTADRTGQPTGSLDAVVSGLVLNFLPDLEATLEEATRILAPGGIAAGYVWNYADGMTILRRFWDAAAALDPAARALDEAVRFPIAQRGPLGAAFSRSGLREVAVTSIEVQTPFPDADSLWRPFLGGTGPAPAYVASLSDERREALRRRFLGSIAVEPDGTIRLAARAFAVRGAAPP